MDAADFSAVLSEVRRFVRERVVPLEEEIDEEDEIPADDPRRRPRRWACSASRCPRSTAASGLTMSEEVQLVFELGYTTPAFRSLFGTNNGIAGQVLMRRRHRGAEEARGCRGWPRAR